MNKKPTSCPICGSTWLAELGECERECLDCGAVGIQFCDLTWGFKTKEWADELSGPVRLTRNARMWSKEGLNKLCDDLGLPDTP